MIYKTLRILADKFEQYLSNKFKLEEKITVLSGLSADDGISEAQNTNKLIVTLAGVERDTSMGISFKPIVSQNNKNYVGRPSVSLNLYVLVSANFIDKNYDESLKYLSSALEMIQSNDLLNEYNTPGLGPEISKLHLELENMSFHEMSNIWSIFGGKYIPSFLLKVRMLTISKEEIESVEHQADDVKLQT